MTPPRIRAAATWLAGLALLAGCAAPPPAVTAAPAPLQMPSALP